MGRAIIEIEFHDAAEKNDFHSYLAADKYKPTVKSLRSKVDRCAHERGLCCEIDWKENPGPGPGWEKYPRGYQIDTKWYVSRRPPFKVRYPRFGAFEVTVKCTRDFSTTTPPQLQRGVEVWSKLTSKRWPPGECGRLANDIVNLLVAVQGGEDISGHMEGIILAGLEKGGSSSSTNLLQEQTSKPEKPPLMYGPWQPPGPTKGACFSPRILIGSPIEASRPDLWGPYPPAPVAGAAGAALRQRPHSAGSRRTQSNPPSRPSSRPSSAGNARSSASVGSASVFAASAPAKSSRASSGAASSRPPRPNSASRQRETAATSSSVASASNAWHAAEAPPAIEAATTDAIPPEPQAMAEAGLTSSSGGGEQVHQPDAAPPPGSPARDQQSVEAAPALAKTPRKRPALEDLAVRLANHHTGKHPQDIMATCASKGNVSLDTCLELKAFKKKLYMLGVFAQPYAFNDLYSELSTEDGLEPSLGDLAVALAETWPSPLSSAETPPQIAVPASGSESGVAQTAAVVGQCGAKPSEDQQHGSNVAVPRSAEQADAAAERSTAKEPEDRVAGAPVAPETPEQPRVSGDRGSYDDDEFEETQDDVPAVATVAPEAPEQPRVSGDGGSYDDDEFEDSMSVVQAVAESASEAPLVPALQTSHAVEPDKVKDSYDDDEFEESAPDASAVAPSRMAPVPADTAVALEAAGSPQAPTPVVATAAPAQAEEAPAHEETVRPAIAPATEVPPASPEAASEEEQFEYESGFEDDGVPSSASPAGGKKQATAEPAAVSPKALATGAATAAAPPVVQPAALPVAGPGEDDHEESEIVSARPVVQPVALPVSAPGEDDQEESEDGVAAPAEDDHEESDVASARPVVQPAAVSATAPSEDEQDDYGSEFEVDDIEEEEPVKHAPEALTTSSGLSGLATEKPSDAPGRQIPRSAGASSTATRAPSSPDDKLYGSDDDGDDGYEEEPFEDFEGDDDGGEVPFAENLDDDAPSSGGVVGADGRHYDYAEDLVYRETTDYDMDDEFEDDDGSEDVEEPVEQDLPDDDVPSEVDSVDD